MPLIVAISSSKWPLWPLALHWLSWPFHSPLRSILSPAPWFRSSSWAFLFLIQSVLFLFFRSPPPTPILLFQLYNPAICCFFHSNPPTSSLVKTLVGSPLFSCSPVLRWSTASVLRSWPDVCSTIFPSLLSTPLVLDPSSQRTSWLYYTSPWDLHAHSSAPLPDSAQITNSPSAPELFDSLRVVRSPTHHFTTSLLHIPSIFSQSPAYLPDSSILAVDHPDCNLDCQTWEWNQPDSVALKLPASYSPI